MPFCFNYVVRARHFMMACVGLLLVALPLTSCGTPAPLQFTSLNLGIPSAALNSPVVGQLPGTTVLHVRITFKIDPKLLQQMQNQKIVPGQPSHLEQFANKLGISDSTYQKIKDFFSPAGIALKLSKLRTQLSVDAKAQTFAKLMQTKFVMHKYNGRTFYAPTPAPRLPQFLVNSVDAVTGLDNYSTPPVHDFTLNMGVSKTTHTVNTTSSLQNPAQDCQPLDQTLLPRQVAHAYGYDQLWNKGWNGENMTVNLVEIDGFYQNDINNYLDCINFKGKLSTVDVDGSPTQALGEATLDVQMIAGLARSVNIVDYETDGNTNGDVWVNINDELQQILNDNVNNANAGSTVSISLGIAENQISSQDVAAINSSIQQLTDAEHMTVFVASGDCGAFTTQQYGQLSVSFPASDTNSVAVGGTIMSIYQNYTRAHEIVWSDGSNRSKCGNQWGSGGGNSIMFKRPSWQNASGVNNQYSRGVRQLPDVSAVAYALAVYYQGRWGAVGGTSAAAPIWATGLALVNEGTMQQIRKFGYSPQLFYLVADKSSSMQPYFDVTQGNNLYYPATSGWDFSSGLGTPNLSAFYQAVCNDIM